MHTLNSDIDVSFPSARAVLGLYSVDTTVVPVSITNEHAAGSNTSGNLDVNHGPLVDLFSILVPDNLGDWTSSYAAVELDILSSPKCKNLVFGPLNLRNN